MDIECIGDAYCPELGDFCNGVLECFDCPYIDKKLKDMIIGVLT